MRRSAGFRRIVILLLIILGVAAVVYVVVPRANFFETERGGALVEGVAGSPQSINPLFSQYNDVDRDIGSLIFEGLTDFDSRGVIVPRLAESWDVSDDGLTYTFKLREDVVWHDDAPFTAEDVLFTVSIIGDPDFLLLDSSGMFDLWSSVTADKLDDYRVQYALSEPFTPFLDYTTLGILPAHLLSKISVSQLAKAQFNSQPVGTGPFTIETVDAKKVRLVANPAYYGQKPVLESLTFRFYPDAESLFTAYENREIDAISHVVPALMPRVAGERALDLYSARLSKYSLVLFNLTDETLPFSQSPEVRQALLWGLDREAIVNKVLGGQGLVAHSPMIPDTWAYNAEVFEYDHDPSRARELLDQAGWADADGDGIREKDGYQLEFSLISSDDPVWTRVVQEMARQWKEIGVHATPEVVSLPRLVGEFLYPRRFEAALIAPEFAGDPDPYPFWHSTQIGQGGQNWSGFANRRADEIMEEARVTTDQPRRIELYREFQDIFAEQVPAILLYYPIYNYAIDAEVKNVQVAPMNDPSDRFRTISGWYIETKHFVFGGK